MEGPTVEYDRKIRQMLDKQEICDVLTRYCRGVDRLDADLINSVYHPDATDIRAYGNSFGPGEDHGEFLVDHMLQRDRSLHFISNITIKLEGDVAHCETYYHAHDYNDDGEDTTVLHAYGRYWDRFERRNGEWKIARRVVIGEQRQTERIAGPRRQPNVQSLRSREDPSYHPLERVGA